MFTFKKRNFACLRDWQDIFVRFMRLRRGLSLLIFGSELSLLFNYPPGLDLSFCATLFASGSSPYSAFASDSSFVFVCTLLVGGYPYSGCCEVAIASTDYHHCNLSQ